MTHGIEIDFERHRDFAHRRHTLPWPQYAGADRGQYLVADLDLDRDAAIFDVKGFEHQLKQRFSV
jgi:hypothetical protein